MDLRRTLPGVALAIGAITFLAPAQARAQQSSGGVQPTEAQSALARRATGIDDSGNYQQEVQACKTGRTQESRDTCLREARAAQAARKRGQLEEGHEDYTANALARCKPLQGEYQAACEARVMGFGTASGSVAGGGMLRSVETVVAPPGATTITIVPKTPDPVVLVPRAAK